MNFENITSENIVVAYLNDKAIAVNEWGTVFYMELPEEFVEIGDVVPAAELIPIDELSREEQAEILDAIGAEV